MNLNKSDMFSIDSYTKDFVVSIPQGASIIDVIANPLSDVLVSSESGSSVIRYETSIISYECTLVYTVSDENNNGIVDNIQCKLTELDPWGGGYYIQSNQHLLKTFCINGVYLILLVELDESQEMSVKLNQLGL